MAAAGPPDVLNDNSAPDTTLPIAPHELRRKGSRLQPAAFDQPLELRPRRATELIDVAFRLWRRTFRLVAPVATVVAVVFAAISAVSAYNNTRTSFSTGPSTGIGLALGPLSILIMFLYSLVLIPVLHNAMVAGDAPLRESVKRGLRRGPMAVLYTLASIIAFSGITLVGLIAFGFAAGAIALLGRVGGVVGVVIIIIVGVAVYLCGLVAMIGLATRFQVGVVAFVVESEGVFNAIRRGFRLTKGRWLAFGGAQTVVLILSYLVIGIPTGLAFAAASNTGARPTYVAIAAFFASLLYIFWWAPMYTGLGVAMYVDGRVRLEAIDLDSLTAKLSDGWEPVGP